MSFKTNYFLTFLLLGIFTQCVYSFNHIATMQQDFFLRAFHTQERSCAIPATWLVMKNFGYDITVDEIVRDLPISSSGTNMFEIASYFNSNGLETDSLICSKKHLYSIINNYPQSQVIFLLRNSHWVLICKKKDSRIVYFDYPNWNNLKNEDVSNLNNIIVIWPPGSKSMLRINSYIDYAIIIIFSISFLILFWPFRSKNLKNCYKKFFCVMRK